MSCADIELRIPDFVAGHLPDEEAWRIDEHLVTCDTCRSYCQQVKGLYSVDLEAPALEGAVGPERPLPVLPRTSTASPRVTRLQWVARAIRYAALFLIVVLLGLLAWDRYRTPDWQPLALEAFAVDLEPLPEPQPAGQWITDLDTAERLSGLTGLPIVAEWGLSMCPLCQQFEATLDEAPSRDLLAEFVRFRGSLQGILKGDYSGIPEWVFQEKDGQRFLYQPVIRIAWDDDHATEPTYSAMSHDSTREQVQRWREVNDRLQVEPLGSERFAQFRIRLLRIPHLLEQGRVAEACDALEAIVNLDGDLRTSLVEVGRDLLVQIDAQIDGQIDEIERLYEGSRVQRAQAIDLAQRFRVQLGLHAPERLARIR